MNYPLAEREKCIFLTQSTKKQTKCTNIVVMSEEMLNFAIR